MSPGVRYYCIVAPSRPGEALLGFDYLEAIDGSGVGVRACPIGAAFLMDKPWIDLLHLFSGEAPKDNYVNVVCAPIGCLLGSATSGVDFAGPKGSPDVVYRPQTALAGLYTVGVPNVAITLPHEDDADLQALQQYDFVLCPSDNYVEAFHDIGVTAHHVPPDPGQLGKLFAALLQ